MGSGRQVTFPSLGSLLEASKDIYKYQGNCSEGVLLGWRESSLDEVVMIVIGWLDEVGRTWWDVVVLLLLIVFPKVLLVVGDLEQLLLLLVRSEGELLLFVLPKGLLLLLVLLERVLLEVALTVLLL